MINIKSKCPRAQQGAVAIEAALVIPTFMLLVAGIVQFAMIFAAQINIRNASAVGARTAVILVEGGTLTSTDRLAAVQTRTQNAIVAPLTPGNATITLNENATVNSVTYREVVVSYPLPVLFLSFFPGLGTNVTLTAKTVMR